MVKNIRHTGIAVFELDRAIKFYRDILGLKLVEEENLDKKFVKNLFNWEHADLRYAKLKTQNDKTLLELWFFKFTIDVTPAFSHIAFTVDNLDKIYKKLVANKITCVSEPMLDPSGKHKLCFCKDTEGNLLELVEEIKVKKIKKRSKK